jgi:hypothetical protein
MRGVVVKERIFRIKSRKSSYSEEAQTPICIQIPLANFSGKYRPVIPESHNVAS